MYSMMSVSCRHISKKTADWLNEQGEINATSRGACIHAGSHSFGWFVYCHDEFDERYPEDLVSLLKWARGKGAEYVNIDVDGEQHEEREVYQW